MRMISATKKIFRETPENIAPAGDIPGDLTGMDNIEQADSGRPWRYGISINLRMKIN